MSDIVESLRYWALPPAGETREPENAALLKWAADEIERLRRAAREMSEACYAFNDGNRDPWVRFNASLSRLREALGETVSYQWSTATHPYPRERTWSDCEADLALMRAVMRRVANELGRENEGLVEMIREALGDAG